LPPLRPAAARWPAAHDDDAHLHALRRAVGGATRDELEPEIEGMLASRDGACAVLDDVFGSADGPFAKWEAAQRAAHVELH
jgi:hypothetical protein